MGQTIAFYWQVEAGAIRMITLDVEWGTPRPGQASNSQKLGGRM